MPLTARKTHVLSVDDPSDLSHWDELVGKAPISDVYYRPWYARANEAADHAKAIALILTSTHVRVLVPLLLRSLSDLPFAQGESGFDAITPYGYGGLLPLSETDRPDEADTVVLLEALLQWCQDFDVVSCHIRLHPLLEQDQWLNMARFQDTTTSLCFRALTTGVDLSRWDSAGQRIVGMTENRRLSLNRARRCLRVVWGESGIPMDEALRFFREVYQCRMTQLNANPYYYFSDEYYTLLAEGTNLSVALAWLDDELVAGHLFLMGRQFAHYHLGGANQKGLELNANALLINAGAQRAREHGCKVLHLGGGANSVFEYKKSYGGPIYRYYTLDVVSDKPRYLNLLKRRLQSEALPPPREGFFPRYRA
jgi:hypothetical protein